MQQIRLTDFEVFKYHLPSDSATIYAANAIKVLQTLPMPSLPYFLSADIVLTLSGVRAFDTYITFDGLGPKQVAGLQKTLAGQDFTLQPEFTEYEDHPLDVYNLVNHAAMELIPKQYQFDGWYNPNPPYTLQRLIVWTYCIERTLSGMMESGQLPKSWLKTNWWAAHNIRFGILLGYPGEAIACACWMDALGEKQMPKSVISKIAHHDAYDSAWPTYYYTEAVRENPNILAHQTLWSDILTKVYESPWHRALKANAQFVETAAKVHKLKEPIPPV